VECVARGFKTLIGNHGETGRTGTGRTKSKKKKDKKKKKIRQNTSKDMGRK